MGNHRRSALIYPSILEEVGGYLEKKLLYTYTNAKNELTANYYYYKRRSFYPFSLKSFLFFILHPLTCIKKKRKRDDVLLIVAKIPSPRIH